MLRIEDLFRHLPCAARSTGKTGGAETYSDICHTISHGICPDGHPRKAAAMKYAQNLQIELLAPKRRAYPDIWHARLDVDWRAGLPTLEPALLPFNGAATLTFATPANVSFSTGFPPPARRIGSSYSDKNHARSSARLGNEDVPPFFAERHAQMSQTHPRTNFFHFFLRELF